MFCSATRWPIPLDRPPRIHYAGWGVFGTSVQSWRLDFWCLHLYRYRADLWLDGRPFPIRPGYAGIVPPRAFKQYRFQGRSEHLAAHFYLPEENRPASSIPAMQELGRDFEELWSDFQEATEYFPTEPRRAEARFWDLLWRLSDRRVAGPPRRPASPLEEARRIIERQLGRALRVEDLAEEVGLSHNQLTRRFRASTGRTVVAYIRARRVQRAEHLLRHSTLPIKAIAAEVGIPDLHLFNKIVRRELGRPPRQVRERGLRSKKSG